MIAALLGNQSMKRTIIFILTIFIFVSALMAIPAKRGFINYVQPDGEIIKVRIEGDEHGHSVYSESGFLLVESNGKLEYAAFDERGFPIPSGTVANKVNEKSKVASRLQTMTQISRWNELMNVNKASRLERLSQNATTFSCDTRAQDERLVPKNFGRCSVSFPVLGEQKGLVILVEYKDKNFSFGDREYFQRMLNEEGFSDFGSFGSARDWFIENSNGKFLPDFDVYGPVELPNNRSFYGGNDAYGNDKNPHMMVVHACQILDDEIDFSQYDRDGDGIIDNIFLFYAGIGEHDSNETNAIWPHSWDMESAMPSDEFIFDGVKLMYYACSCEYPNGYDRPDGIGTFVHEFSHVMGLPDLYVTSHSNGFTPGEWDTLDSGPYNNDGLTPPNYSSFEKCALGWIEFQPLRSGLIELPDFSESGVAYALPTEQSNEFFFFENRQQQGNDLFLPGHGMLVWHVDFRKNIWDANEVNNSPNHQHVDLIEADNLKTESTRNGDPFPGSNDITSFGFDTTPQLASWNMKRLNNDIQEITETTDGVIRFVATTNDNLSQESVKANVEISQYEDYYDLFGRKVSNPRKGVYIHNGKKVIL